MQGTPVIKTVEPLPMASIHTHSRMDQIGPTIMATLSRVYPVIKRTPGLSLGLNVVVYRPSGVQPKWPDGEIPMECGVLVSAPFKDEDEVKYSAVPGGKVAFYRYTGDYSGLPAANQDLRKWCEDQKLEMSGIGWELYGHWDEDPKKLITDIVYMVK